MGEDLGQRFDEVLGVDTKDEALRLCRTRQGAEDVEYGAEAELLAQTCHVLHGLVVLLSVEERNVDLFKELVYKLRILVNIHAKRIQHVRGAGLACRRRVAVLTHGHATGSGHYGRGCRNVEGVRVVATRADDLQDFNAGMLNLGRVVAHSFRRAHDLVDSLGVGGLGGQCS